MSTDWSKYGSPEATRAHSKDPSLNGVISLGVGIVRRIPGLSVQHAPLPTNRAHSNVLGDKKRDPEVRVKLGRIFQWRIRPA